MTTCVVCGEGSQSFRHVDGYEYFTCSSCEMIFIDPAVLSDMDAGAQIVDYRGEYWHKEISAARQRAYGVALARVAEVMLYVRRPVHRFLDVGSGPGYLLDALKHQLPNSHCFYGVELFPPEPAFRTAHPNYRIGRVGDLTERFDAGVCIEVVEHMTPTMVDGLLRELASVSSPRACYLFNTGLAEFVRHEDPGYLDPRLRGHVVSWTVKAMDILCRRHGFRAKPIPGKSWAFIVELDLDSPENEDVRDRIWSADSANVAALNDAETGNLMYVLGLDTVRAYG